MSRFLKYSISCALIWSALIPVLLADAGSLACAPCHQAIWKSYSATAMARSSGPVAATKEFVPQTFASPGGTVSYSVNGQRYSAKTDAVEISRPLDYFIGSGAVGRSYMTRADGYLFQAPVSFYASDGKWRVSPGFDRSESLNIARPVETSCLNCHASGTRPVAGTVNRYGDPPFEEGGISCERCHGPGERHVRARTRQTIVNPARLASAQRDSICSQCHLSGEVRVAKLGQDRPFAPGELLSESSTTFVWSPPQARQVNGHVEELSRSRCKLASGDKLWCGTCHDPHSVPAPDRKAGWYRDRCFTCHNDASCTQTPKIRAARADDCVACHMPRSEVRDVQHAAYTNHTIPKLAGQLASVSGSSPVLVPFGASGTERDLALASALVALRENDRSLGARAFELLRTAWRLHNTDVAAGSQLAQLYDRMGQEDKACELYGQIAQSNLPPPAAVNNWGTCLAKSGRLAESIPLWKSVTVRNLAEESAWTNLAVAQIQSGDRAAGRATLENALRFHPASAKAKQLLLEVDP